MRNSDLAADPRVRAGFPVLAQAVLAGASGQLRNMATVGGNLLQRTRCLYFQDVTKPCNKRVPGSGCPARAGEHRNLAILGGSPHCVATHPSDMAVALAALDAVVHVEGAAGRRAMPLGELYRLPGDEPDRETTLDRGDLITAVEVPALGYAGNSAYRKVRDRASYAFGVASVAAALDVADGVVREARIALGAVAPLPWRARRAEQVLAGQAGHGRVVRPRRRRRTGRGRAAARQCVQGHPGPQHRGPDALRAGRGPSGRRRVTARVDGPDKVTGRARYAFEHQVDGAAYVWAVPSVIAKGTIRSVDASDALALPGVLAVLTPDNAPRLPGTGDPELALFQSRAVAYRGQFVAAAVADTLEAAREAASLVMISYEQAAHDVTLTASHPGLYKPDFVNPRYQTDTAAGDFDGAFAAAAVRVDATYRTPAEHNHPMEPHATVAAWHGDTLTVYDSTQGPSRTAGQIAAVFGLEPGQVRVIAEHVGGGFGAKGMPRPNVILAAMAARVTGRPVKCAVTRPQMFAVTGHRAPAIQRVRLGASPDGRLAALCHDVFDQTSTLKEFTEQSAVATRHMYAAPHRRTTHRVVRLDVPTPSWMRAPGECPGMFALESAMDELAEACRIDPVELRIRNEPGTHPETGQPFSSRHLTACLREGAARFGWAGRDPAPGARRDGRWLTGTGVAASTYPARAMASQARVTVSPAGRYQVSIAAADIGTGARTALLAVAADALGVPAAVIDLRIGDSALPPAMIAGGSMGTASWTWAVIKACRAAARPGPGQGRGRAARRAHRARRHRGGHRRAARPRQVLLRRPVRRGAGRRRHRGGPGAAAARRVRRRPHHQPRSGQVAADRRDDHGPVHGAARGERDGPGVRRLPQSRPGRVPHSGARRRAGHRGGMDRRGGTGTRAGRGQGHRRGRDRGHRRRDRQRGVPRHRDPGPRPAHPARQAAQPERALARPGRARLPG